MPSEVVPLTTQRGLFRFDKMKQAIAECLRIDEVKEIRDQAHALREYSRRANDREAQENLNEVIAYCTRKVGLLMIELRPGEGRAEGGGRTQREREVASSPQTSNSSSPPTLRQMGIDGNLAHQARSFARYDDQTFQARVVPAERARASRRRNARRNPLPSAGAVNVDQFASIAKQHLSTGIRELVNSGKMKTMVEIAPELSARMAKSFAAGIDEAIDALRKYKDKFTRRRQR